MKRENLFSQKYPIFMRMPLKAPKTAQVGIPKGGVKGKISISGGLSSYVVAPHPFLQLKSFKSP